MYRGTGDQHDGLDRLPAPPPWRRFDGAPPAVEPAPQQAAPSLPPGLVDRAKTYRPSPEVVDAVNAAMVLRRPLLVTGRPGTGKSSLALSIAHELGLGQVLHWPVTSRSQLQDALYRYDAIGRLQETNLYRTDAAGSVLPIGRYLRLGPLGTALLPRRRPRVLLVDELDKSDMDLPNDLLNVFEEGQFEIPELARLVDTTSVEVGTADPGETATVENGIVRCHEFPIVVITNNSEREFPSAFLRRCLRINVQPPDNETLTMIVQAQLGAEATAAAHEVIARFRALRRESELATDQLLNAIYLTTSVDTADPATMSRLVDGVLTPLTWNPPI
ncbi:MoxR family ATPase [Dactylosporangium roseum]|uniref:MoxR family ATPase n=1 Tax=Dactylosporangium roseum TaxID=47989 RepID=A0ABY5ZGG9_9ACTN|nr:MoxR family ATPase [Dactylosporangium roseum]